MLVRSRLIPFHPTKKYIYFYITIGSCLIFIRGSCGRSPVSVFHTTIYLYAHRLKNIEISYKDIRPCSVDKDSHLLHQETGVHVVGDSFPEAVGKC